MMNVASQVSLPAFVAIGGKPIVKAVGDEP
jgi:hypothetical protein